MMTILIFKVTVQVEPHKLQLLKALNLSGDAAQCEKSLHERDRQVVLYGSEDDCEEGKKQILVFLQQVKRYL
jgi:hypothetical protein